jgi:hypothetical protein
MTVYKFSRKTDNEKNEILSVEELTKNVKKLVRHAFTIERQPNDGEAPPQVLLVGKTVKHKFIEHGQEIWWQGQVISQVFLHKACYL